MTIQVRAAKTPDAISLLVVGTAGREEA